MIDTRFKPDEQLSLAFDQEGEMANGVSCPVFVTRRVEHLRPHPRYEELCGPIHEKTLFDMAKRGEALFEEPLSVTDTGIVLDGYKRWLLARDEGRDLLFCYQYSIDDDREVLRFLVDLQLRKPAIQCDFFRILLALELEPMLMEAARERQRIGGREKGSSNLTKARPLDVRSEIARMAGVSAGNVTKVKQVLAKGRAEIIDALRAKEISIHQGHGWSKEPPERQIELLRELHDVRDIRQHISKLLSKHSTRKPLGVSSPSEFAQLLHSDPDKLEDVEVEVIKGKGKRIFVTEGLMDSLGFVKDALD